MYPFPASDAAFADLWRRLTARVSWLPSELDHSADVGAIWSSPQLAIAQTCGWPLITSLHPRVRLIGAFELTLPDAQGVTYRSVVVASRPGRLESFVGARAAVNSVDSLSGWVSLVWAVHGPRARWAGGVRLTGSHAASLAAVATGTAEIASIDALSYTYITESAPELSGAVHVVGWGPRVPSLPLIAGPTVSDAQLGEVREALADVVADPTFAGAAEGLRARAFRALDIATYRPLLALGPAP
jgi:ABC-type phosphate/phosphonate transport system substrate-binding protein